MLNQVQLITPLRELNRLPGMPAIGPLKRGLLRRQAGISQGKHQGGWFGCSKLNGKPQWSSVISDNCILTSFCAGRMAADPAAFVGPMGYALLQRSGLVPPSHTSTQAAQVRLVLGSSLGESPELLAALQQQRLLLVAQNSAPASHQVLPLPPRSAVGALKAQGSAPLPSTAAGMAGSTPRRRTAGDAYGGQRSPDGSILGPAWTDATPVKVKAATLDNYPGFEVSDLAPIVRLSPTRPLGSIIRTMSLAAAAAATWKPESGMMSPTKEGQTDHTAEVADIGIQGGLKTEQRWREASASCDSGGHSEGIVAVPRSRRPDSPLVMAEGACLGTRPIEDIRLAFRSPREWL